MLLTTHECNSSSSNAKLIRSLIFETPDRQNLLESFSIFQTTHDSVYSVILLRIDFTSPRYFDIDLELGYYTSYSAMRSSLLNAVKNNKYMTQRDYYAFIDGKHIVIIKSLLVIMTCQNCIALDVISSQC